MSVRRHEILRELGLWPVWRLRGPAVPHRDAEATMLRSAGDPPAVSSHLTQGIHSRGYLPHLKAEAGVYFVTFRLADSLPAPILGQLDEIPEEQRSKQIEQYLDAAHGECWLRKPDIAEMLSRVVQKFQGERYHLHAWVIMPNHVHMLVEPVTGSSLSEILQGIKSVSAHEANRLLRRQGEFWQKESYDHLIRDDADHARCVEYIAQNPVKAGLAKSAEGFRFSSVYRAQSAAGESPALQDHHNSFPVGPRSDHTTPVLPLDARVAEIMRMDWPQLKASVAGCVACPLHKGRNKTVFGVGDERASWLLVGEAPGADEDLKGEPFVRQAGKLLDNMLAAIGLKRGANVYIANVVKSRPPGNRNPEPLEVAQCEPYLQRQIELLEPKLIVALGKVAAVNLLHREASVASLRGKVLEYHGIPMIVTYHPAYLLRSLPEKAKAWADLCFAVETMGVLQSRPAVPI